MIVLVLMGIGIGFLVLMQGKDQSPPEGDTTAMTNLQIASMLADDEKARRRARFESGIGPAQWGQRVESRKRPTRAASKASIRREQW